MCFIYDYYAVLKTCDKSCNVPHKKQGLVKKSGICTVTKQKSTKLFPKHLLCRRKRKPQYDDFLQH